MTNTFATLNGWFTEAYGSAVEILPPAFSKLQKMISFEEGEKVGNLYHQPVVLSRETGIMFNSDGSAFATTDPGAGPVSSEDAQLRGSETLLESKVAYSVTTRMLGGKKQFARSSRPIVEANASAHAYHLELSLLYGQTGIAATSEITASGTTGTFVVTAATWAEGIWHGSKGMSLDLFAVVSDAAAINTNAAVVVTSIDFDTRTVSFTCNSSDASALNSASTSTVFRRRANAGSSSFREMAGVDKILSNTGSLFNVSASTYDMWKSQTYSAGSAPLTMGKVQAGLAKAVSAGLMDTNVVLLCNPVTWSNLMTDLAALRVLDSSYNNRIVENGSKSVTFHSQNGSIEISPHILVKQGEAFCIAAKEDYIRVGSTDVTFVLPGIEDGKMFFHLSSNAGYAFRSYSDQALFCKAPARSVKFTNIVNNT